MVALPSDVARGKPKAKQAFEAVFGAMARFLERDVHLESDTHKQTYRTAQAIAALCVGGMVGARAIDDREVADELRKACVAVALELGGWRR